MQLLVSVADAADAVAAIEGGADIIDAKDPSRGPLGPVSAAALDAILAAVAGRRPVSVAEGDGSVAGVAFVKRTIPCLIQNGALVLAAYADAPGYERVIDLAAHSGAKGVLLDTGDKSGPGLFSVLSEQAIGRWVDAARAAGLMVALAGKLSAPEILRAESLGVDIVGVRGAVCEGGRGGRVSAGKVRALIAQRRTAATPAYCESANT